MKPSENRKVFNLVERMNEIMDNIGNYIDIELEEIEDVEED